MCGTPLDSAKLSEGARQCYRCSEWLLPALASADGALGNTFGEQADGRAVAGAPTLLHEAARLRAVSRQELRARIADVLLDDGDDSD